MCEVQNVIERIANVSTLLSQFAQFDMFHMFVKMVYSYCVVLSSHSLKTKLHMTEQILVARTREFLKIVIFRQGFIIEK